MNATEYRALGRLMRYARAQGYTYYRTTVFGRTDWSWSKDSNYAVVAEPLAVGWKVTFDDGRVNLWPASVQQLADVMVALRLLPDEFSSVFAEGVDWVETEKVRPLRKQLQEIKDIVGWFEPGDEQRAINLRDQIWEQVTA